MRIFNAFLLACFMLAGNLMAQETHPLLGRSYIIDDAEMLTLTFNQQNQITCTILDDTLTVSNTATFGSNVNLTITDVAAGYEHGLVMNSAGYITAWGRDDYSQVSNEPPENDFVQVTAGGYHNLALKSDGSVFAWGRDDKKQVSNTPADNDFIQVAAGGFHNLALKSDGSIVAWGGDDYKQVSNTPAGNDFIQVAAGYNHSVALKSDSSIVAWGRNNHGQVSNVPDGNDFIQITAGGFHNLALKSDGSVVAWGSNSWGQISKPTGNDFIRVSGGYDHSLALKSDGSMVAWGRDDNKQVSDTPAGNDFIQIAAGGFHNLALKSDGSAIAWGKNDMDQCNVRNCYQPIDIITGDLNGDLRDDYVFGYISQGQIILGLGDGNGMVSTHPTANFIKGAYAQDVLYSSKTDFHIAVGNFDLDSPEEVVLAYWTPDDKIIIKLYETGNKLYNLVNSATIQYKYPLKSPIRHGNNFDIATGDFDGDGTDELVIVTFDTRELNGELQQSVWCEKSGARNTLRTDLFAMVYDYDYDAQEFVPKTEQLLEISFDNFASNDPSPWYYNIAAIAGDLDNDYREEFTVAFDVYGKSFGVIAFFLPFSVNTAPWQVTGKTSFDWEAENIFHDKEYIWYTIWDHSIPVINECHPLSIECADLFGDGSSNVIAMSGAEWRFLCCVNTLNPILDHLQFQISNPSWSGDNTFSLSEFSGALVWDLPPEYNYFHQNNVSHCMIAVGEVNEAADRLLEKPDKEILIAYKSSGYGWVVITYRFMWLSHNNPEDPTAGNYGLIMGRCDFQPNQGYNIWPPYKDFTPGSNLAAIVLGDFDGNAIRTEYVRHIAKNSVLQPLVILNAPPIHFDYLDGIRYDVNKVYDPNSANTFYAVYEKSTSTQFETKVKSDWGYSEKFKVDGSGTFDFLSLSSSISNTIEKKFSYEEFEEKTVEVTERRETQEDDLICSTVTDYDFYEYAIYQNGKSLGNVLIVYSHYQGLDWRKSLLWDGMDYGYNHEVGNILSYPPEIEIRNLFNCATFLHKFNPSFASERIGTDWTINFEEVFGSETEISKTTDLEVSSSVGVWGIEGGFDGEYTDGEITTHSSTFRKGVNITLHIDGIDASIGEVDYKVTPFVYWARNGALVVDYAVDPYTSPTENSWWQTHYGSKPDPAFILPWRYYPEKDYGIEPEKIFKTRSIRMCPAMASEGDTVEIIARIHNFSLIEAPKPVTVRFYIDHPDSGGTPIIGHGDITELIIPDAIPARSYREVSMSWIVPPGLEGYTKIYGVIDQDNLIDEVHEDNNIGYINFADITVSVDEYLAGTVPNRFRLYQNYPNPFNPMTTIRYEIPEPANVEIRIYDILGRFVFSLVNEHQQPGQYEYKWDGMAVTNEYVSSGIYLYQIKAGDYTHTKKMLFIK